MTKRNGNTYYAYILVYVDDVILIDTEPIRFMKSIEHDFKLKEGSLKQTDTYLGAFLSQVDYEDGTFSWVMGCESYLGKVIKNLKKKLETDGYTYDRKLSY